MLRVLEGKMMHSLQQIIHDRLPNEAVGLILPDGEVVELPNRSLEPESNFSINRGDIMAELQTRDLPIITDVVKNCTLWHSHPSGGVGPSRIDMRNRPGMVSNLVLAVDSEGELIPSWY